MTLKRMFVEFGTFNIVYMFVMVIYMAQATPETSRMIAGLSGNPVPFLIPIVLTFLLCWKHRVHFNNKNLYSVLSVYCVWAVCSLIKYGSADTSELSYHFFMIYAIVLAYIHNKVFGYKLLPIYENIVVLLSKISIFAWLIAVLIPPSAILFRLFPETAYGNHIIYLFNWMDPAKGQIYSGILRNAGCSWEPGRFSIMLSLAIFCNLCQNGIKFKYNTNIWWLLAALVTTQSTTGFFVVLAMYSIFLMKKFNLKYIFVFVVVMIPIIYGSLQLDFMGEKVRDRLTDAQDISRLYEQFDYHSRTETKGKYLGSLDRFDAMAFEWLNFTHDPILGYGRNFQHSYFYNNVSTNYSLANGLVKILSSYGIFMGLFFFMILAKSSVCLSNDSNEKRAIGLFVLFILSAISYPILSIPVFTSFWFYGFFRQRSQ